MNYDLTINLDEFGQELNNAISRCKSLNIKHVEIRSMNGKNILDFTDKELKVLKERITGEGIEVTAIASPLFKWTHKLDDNSIKVDNYFFPSRINVDKQEYYIKRVFEIATLLEVNIIRIFSYVSNVLDKKILIEDEMFNKALELGRENKIFVAVENEPICILNTIEDMKWITKMFISYNAKLWFDISNFYYIDNDIMKKDFIAIRNSIAYIQMKDFVSQDELKEYVPLLTGDVPYKRIIPWIMELISENVPLNIETHINTDKYHAIKHSYDNLRSFITSSSTNI